MECRVLAPVREHRVPTAFLLLQACAPLRPPAHPLALDSSSPLNPQKPAMSTPLLKRHQELPATYKIKFLSLTISDPGYLKPHFIHLLNRGPLLGVPMALSSCDST